MPHQLPAVPQERPRHEQLGILVSESEFLSSKTAARCNLGHTCPDGNLGMRLQPGEVLQLSQNGRSRARPRSGTLQRRDRK